MIGYLFLMVCCFCEVGVGFVMIYVGYVGVWDMYVDGNNFSMLEGMEVVGRLIDYVIVLFIEDLEVLGLNEKIMLVVIGEMGCILCINKNGGCDYWSKLVFFLVYGGGVV